LVDLYLGLVQYLVLHLYLASYHVQLLYPVSYPFQGNLVPCLVQLLDLASYLFQEYLGSYLVLSLYLASYRVQHLCPVPYLLQYLVPCRVQHLYRGLYLQHQEL